MSDSGVKSYNEFVLPPSVVSRLDVSRLVSELERIDNELTSDEVRRRVNEAHEVPRPNLSEQLDDFLAANELGIDDDQQRSQLVREMRLLKENVPVIHMTFAVQADRESMGVIIHWLRDSVHSQAVVSIGLQPSLVAGVYVRTPNRAYDFTMRARLKENHGKLVGMLEATRGGE